MSLVTLKVGPEQKGKFDRIAELNGGLPHHRLFDALIECWERASDDAHRECIRATSSLRLSDEVDADRGDGGPPSGAGHERTGSVRDVERAPASRAGGHKRTRATA